MKIETTIAAHEVSFEVFVLLFFSFFDLVLEVCTFAHNISIVD